MAFQTSVKTLAATAGRLLSRIVGYTLLGIFLNIVLLAMNWDAVAALWSQGLFAAESSDPQPGARLAGGLLLILIVISPIVYFVLGKKQGMSAAIAHIANQHKVPTIQFILAKFFDRYPELLNDLTASRNVIRQKCSNFHTFTQKQSFLVRTILNRFLSMFDFAGELDHAIAAIDDKNLPHAAKVESLSREMGQRLSLDDMQPGWLLPAMVVGANAGAVGLVRFFVG